MSFRLLYKFQEASIDKNINNRNVWFPNAVYEINNNLVTKEGIKHIKNAHLQHDEKGQGEQLSFEKNLNYFITIEKQLPGTLFSLWKKEHIRLTFFAGEAINTFEKIFSDKETLLQEINDRILDEDVALSPFYNSSFFWVTVFDEISMKHTNLTEVIFHLGLDHYCKPNFTDPKKLCGLVFELKNKKVLKPNFLSSPSKIAYCGKPVSNNAKFGATVNLQNINRGFSEALIPHSYLRDAGAVKMLDVALYNTIENTNYNKENVLNFIYSELGYNPLAKFKIIDSENTITFEEQE